MRFGDQVVVGSSDLYVPPEASETDQKISIGTCRAPADEINRLRSYFRTRRDSSWCNTFRYVFQGV
jgi:hypothetical protein